MSVFDVWRFSLLDGCVYAPFESGKICVYGHIQKRMNEKCIDPNWSMPREYNNIYYKIHKERTSYVGWM